MLILTLMFFIILLIKVMMLKHINYVDHFSRYLPDKIDLPSDKESREFFNPPIGYIVPSITQVICRNTINSNDFLSI